MGAQFRGEVGRAGLAVLRERVGEGEAFAPEEAPGRGEGFAERTRADEEPRDPFQPRLL